MIVTLNLKAIYNLIVIIMNKINWLVNSWEFHLQQLSRIITYDAEQLCLAQTYFIHYISHVNMHEMCSISLVESPDSLSPHPPQYDYNFISFLLRHRWNIAAYEIWRNLIPGHMRVTLSYPPMKLAVRWLWKRFDLILNGFVF